jgi:N-acetylglucosaminylphosphatidylinositol deacetylase
MFFVPTLQCLKRIHGQSLWLLCLTTGDYDGLGKVRSKELYRTADKILKIDKVLLCNHAHIHDDPRRAWDIPTASNLIQTTLEKALKSHAIKFSGVQIITFDQQGVSGHINHRDTYLACRHLCFAESVERHELPNVELWSLVSDTSPIVRYIPFFSWILLLLTWCGVMTSVSTKVSPRGDVCINRLQAPSLNWEAMRSHASQFVWYRRLFVVFSSYTYVNKLRRQSS